jgi:hypothetical protein
LEVHVTVMDQWMVSWRRGVVSSASTMTRLDGVAQQDLDDGRIIKNCMHLLMQRLGSSFISKKGQVCIHASMSHILVEENLFI